MDAQDSREASRLALFAHLERAPWEFDFYQAMRRIECLYPERARLGKASRPREEPVRLAQETSLAFAPSALAACEKQEHGLPHRLEQRCFGLLGPNGPMPLHLTEHALERKLHHGDRTFARFLDVFHHRMLLLFYRAWADAQPTVRADRPKEDRFAFYLGALGGLSTAHQRERDAVPDSAKAFFAGHFAKGVRNAESLESMLKEYFRVPVCVEQLVQTWLPLAPDERSRLGGPPRESIALGRGTVVGKRVCDVQSKFRIRLGPMNAERYESFLPGKPSLTALRDWVRNWFGFEFEWQVTLVLAREEVSAVRLGREGRLGWNSWLGAWRKPHDAADLALTPERPQYMNAAAAAA